MTFDILKQLSLPSQYEEQRATVKTKTMSKVIFEHFAILSISSNQVFLRAYVKNSSNLPLLTGSIDVFIDQQFFGNIQLVGKQSHGVIQPNEEFELFFSTNNNVLIDSKTETEEKEVRFLRFNKKRVTTSKISIKVDSKKDILINIIIMETIPHFNSNNLQLYMDKPLINVAEHNLKETDVVSLLSTYFKKLYVNNIILVTTKQE